MADDVLHACEYCDDPDCYGDCWDDDDSADDTTVLRSVETDWTASERGLL